MNESILRALMQLFAIITDIREEIVSGEAKKLVKKYLERKLNKEYASKYLKLFDKFLEEYHYDKLLSGDTNKINQENITNSVKILQICAQIMDELELEPRLLVILELLEFIKKENKITEQEINSVDIIAMRLNLDYNDYTNLKVFLFDSLDNLIDKTKHLVIDKDKNYSHPQIKHHTNERLNGKINVLHIPSTNTLVFKHDGADTLFLNGHYIKPNRTHVLSVGSLIKSSRIKPIYYSKIIAKFIIRKGENKIEYKAKNISFQFPNSTDGVHRFNFEESSGKLVAIMGSSGTGKSTLLNVLNGNLKLRDGEININGYDLHKDKEILKGLIGFVPQDDLLIEELTVYQNLYYNAKLCLSNLTEEQINEELDNVMKDLNLLESRDLQVGNPLNKFISGGQRKRLNIALELIRKPAILFVDEPTSGLSSNDSETVMNLLKRQTIRGTLIIINIHQPASDLYKLFDSVIILDIGGRIVYNGNPMDAITYFKKNANFVNPHESECLKCGNIRTDQPLKILESRIVDSYGRLIRKRKTSPHEWYSKYIVSFDDKLDIKIPKTKEALPKIKFKKPNLLGQLKVFITRDILSKLHNKQYLLIIFLQAPILAAILGFFTKFTKGTTDNPSLYIFSENKNLPAYFFMSVIVALFIGLVTSAEEIIKDRRINKRESFLNLSRFSYINSKVIQMFVISAFQTLTYVIVGNYILEIKDMTLNFWIIMFTASCLMNLNGLVISSAFNSVVTIYILIPFILVPQLLFSGVVVNFNDLHPKIASPKYIPFIGEMMVSRWAFEAFMVREFKANEYNKHFFKYDQKISEADYYIAYYLPRIDSKLESYYFNKDKKDTKALTKDAQFINRNLMVIGQKYPELNTGQSFIYKNNLINKTTTEAYILLCSKYFQQQRNSFNTQRENILNKLIKENGQDAIIQLKKDYHNKYVGNYVKGRYQMDKFIEFNNEIIRRKDPIYKIPTHQFGRAHFYAPYKILFGKKIDTFKFNIMLLWFFALIIYGVLQFDLLSKLIKYIEKIRFRNPATALHKRI